VQCKNGHINSARCDVAYVHRQGFWILTQECTKNGGRLASPKAWDTLKQILGTGNGTYWTGNLCPSVKFFSRVWSFYQGVKFWTMVQIFYQGMMLWTLDEVLYLGMKLWNFVRGYEILFLGMKFCTRVWSFVPGYEVFSSGMKFSPRVWSFVPGYDFCTWVWSFVLGSTYRHYETVININWTI
jgi:hypothetical protein